MEQGSKTTVWFSLLRSKTDKGSKYYKKKKKCLYFGYQLPFFGKSNIISSKPKITYHNQISKY